MLNTGLVSIFNYLFWLTAGRAITPASIGMVTEAISAAALIVALTRLGMDDSLTRFLPGSKDPAGFYNALIAIILVITSVTSVGFLLGLEYISPALTFLNNWQYSLLFYGYVFLTSICDMQGTALVAIRRADLAFLQYGILIFRIPLLLAMKSFGVIGVFLALDIAYLITFAAGVALLYKKSVARDLHVNIGEALSTIRFSLGNYTSTVMYTAGLMLLPIMIVNVSGSAQAAYFYIAFTVATFLFMVPESVAASMFVEGSHNRPLRETTIKALIFNWMLLAPMVLAVFVFGEPILRLVSPEYSAAAYQLLLLLALSSLFYAVMTVYVTVVQVQKNMLALNLMRFIWSGLILVLGYIMLSRAGLIGVGYAWLLGNVGVCAIVGWRMVREKKW